MHAGLNITFAPDLPVSSQRDEIARAIDAHPVIIVCGETGSGKTTQLPKICLSLGRGQKKLIGHTQPRRLAASTVAKRIAQELGTDIGQVVGYKVRFTDRLQPGAAIKLMTDGILLAETQSDPLLTAYDTIIIDEAHERSLNIDFLMGYLKQLLPRRPDLKVIITSATIDAERFAKHFGSLNEPAPVIHVSGRLYPVHIHYRPYHEADESDERTLMQGIVDAVDECAIHGLGDVLVFLPGERQIREAAEALRKHSMSDRYPQDIVPLFARLSIDEQERVFKPTGNARRIVLATNVAETSLTVPGIRYVVDTGTARVKRYSYRNKVEQLHIEPISQAAAQQRAGRCGRVRDGVCIRLYSEADFNQRPRFTDPEIVRASLASVILRMKSLGLGDVRAFPFVDPPPAKAIADGHALLAELNAMDENGELTPVGKAIARLPLDPKVARMLLAARDAQALAEVLVIAAALSVQDPRERPIEAQAAADQAHKRFADQKSDFVALLKLWDFIHERIDHKKSNRKLTQDLHSHYLSPRRVREWADVQTQLANLVREQGWHVNTTPATYEQLHCALLSGLLGHVGCQSLDADMRAPPYVGARGIKFALWPGSYLGKKAGQWVMAAELVETTRLFGRMVASIEAQWIERVGAHLIKKSWSDAHWERKPAQVMAMERGTLYGLTVYAQRRVPLTQYDPAQARTIFIREALVAGQLDSRADVLAHNQNLVREIRALEHKRRRPDVLVDEEHVFAFYDAHLPAHVCSGATFEKWYAQARAQNPDVLRLSKDELMRHDAASVTHTVFPKAWDVRGVSMALSYHFEPGSPRDGVTLTVPLYALNQLEPVRSEWLVPGMLKEKVQALLKSLPQRFRRHCVPLPGYAADFFERHAQMLESPQIPLMDALMADLKQVAHVHCQAADFKLETLPAHLFMNFKVVDEHGRQLAMGRSVSQLRSELGLQAQQSFQTIAARAMQQHAAEEGAQDHWQSPITDWDFDTLPELLEIERDGQRMVGFPALIDCDTHCQIEVFDDLEDAQAHHKKGLRALFRLQMKEQIKFLEKNLNTLQPAAMQISTVPSLASGLPSFEALRRAIVDTALDRTALHPPWPADKDTFASRKADAKAKVGLIAQEIARLITEMVTLASQITRKLNGLKAFPQAVADVEQQLDRLFMPGFIGLVPAQQLAHYPRYLKAIMARLDALKNDPARDAAHMANMAALQTPYVRELTARKGVPDPKLEEFRWLLEELRVSLWAQTLRTPMPVSVKRLQKVWDNRHR